MDAELTHDDIDQYVQTSIDWTERLLKRRLTLEERQCLEPHVRNNGDVVIIFSEPLISRLIAQKPDRSISPKDGKWTVRVSELN